MSPVDAIKSGISRTFDYKGKTLRSEYWWHFLFVCLTLVSMGIVEKQGMLTGEIYQVIHLVLFFLLFPSLLSASVRRLHDVGRSGWWLLIGYFGIGLLFLIYWMASDTKTEVD